MEFKKFKAKSIEEALEEAAKEFGVSKDSIEYETIDKGSSGFLGIGSKPAVINAKVKNDIVSNTKDYLKKLFDAMQIEADITVEYDKENEVMDIDVEGPDMGILIGKRGQTLDSLQYLISLFVNKNSETYIRIKLDTENYRSRRKETLENLAKNIAFKVKKSRRSFTLEPMNPYERRIIHSTLQNDKFVATKSEGEEPYRKVVVYLKKNDFKGSKKYTNKKTVEVKEVPVKKPAYDYAETDETETKSYLEMAKEAEAAKEKSYATPVDITEDMSFTGGFKSTTVED